jgi:hypothetical protein
VFGRIGIWLYFILLNWTKRSFSAWGTYSRFICNKACAETWPFVFKQPSSFLVLAKGPKNYGQFFSRKCDCSWRLLKHVVQIKYLKILLPWLHIGGCVCKKHFHWNKLDYIHIGKKLIIFSFISGMRQLAILTTNVQFIQFTYTNVHADKLNNHISRTLKKIQRSIKQIHRQVNNPSFLIIIIGNLHECMQDISLIPCVSNIMLIIVRKLKSASSCPARRCSLKSNLYIFSKDIDASFSVSFFRETVDLCFCNFWNLLKKPPHCRVVYIYQNAGHYLRKIGTFSIRLVNLRSQLPISHLNCVWMS